MSPRAFGNHLTSDGRSNAASLPLHRAIIETLERRVLLTDPTCQASFDWHPDDSAPDHAHELVLAFSQNVRNTLQLGDVHITTITGTAAAPVATDMEWQQGTNTVRMRLEAAGGGRLEDGNYRASIFRQDVTNDNGDPLATDVIVDFFVLGGDADHNRSADIADLGTLASHWQHTGISFSKGDFNYDGAGDIADLGALASNWQKNIAEPPDLPGELSVSLPTTNTLTLNWVDSAPQATGYCVERITGDDVFTTWRNITRAELTDGSIDNGTIVDGIVNWKDTSLEQGTLYTYRVRAYGNGYDTGYGDSAEGITRLQRTTDLDALAVSPNTIELSWTDGATTEEGYHVYRSETGSANPVDWTLVGTTAPNVDQYTDSPLDSRTTYYYKVEAFNQLLQASSGQSNMASATTPPNSPHVTGFFEYHPNDVAPSYPNELVFVFDQDVRASLSPSDLRVEVITGPEPDPVATALTTTWNPLTGTLTARFSIQSSQTSNILPDGNYRASIFMDDVTNSDGDPLASDAIVDFFVLGADANHDRSVNITDLGLLATYWQMTGMCFSQADFNYDGTVNITDLGLLATDWQRSIAPPPSAPGMVTVSSPTLASLTLNWQDDSPDAIGYRIQRSTTGQDFTPYTHFTRAELEAAGMIVGGFVNWTDTGLEQGRRYWYRVRAYDDGGGHDTAYTPKRADTTQLEETDDLAVGADPTQAVINLAWSDAANNEAGYHVYRSDNGGPGLDDWMWVGDTGPDATAYSDSTVGFSKTYYYRVEAFNDYTTSLYSNVATTTVPSLQQCMTNTVSGMIYEKEPSDTTYYREH